MKKNDNSNMNKANNSNMNKANNSDMNKANKELRLTPHFTLGEMCKTSHAAAGENMPSPEQIGNLKRLCTWLEELRRRWNERYGDGNDPIVINSGFRCPAVNKAAGGAEGSNHTTGCAADLRCYGLEQALRYATLLTDIAGEWGEAFDELYLERSRRGEYWIHLAVRPSANRRHLGILM